MKFLRKNDSPEPEEAADEVEADEEPQAKGHTPKKGRATPSRREREAKRRGPVAPPPKTTREAIKRSRQLRKENPVSKDDRKQAAKTRRERMMAGDDAYLLPRDRGPVKAFIRDCVDARRNLLGLFMPMAILVFASMLVPVPQVQQWTTLAVFVILLVMVVEGVVNGRRITKLTREKFPKETVSTPSTTWYAFVRASQMRKLRVPKPRVQPGGEPVKAR